MRWVVRGAVLAAAAALICAQGNSNGNGNGLGNGKANGRGDRTTGQAGPGGGNGSGVILLNYNGGPVIVGQSHVYYIYYGNWTVDSKASGILSSFANNLTGSGYYNILTQYYSGSASSPSYISNSVVLSGTAISNYQAANPTDLNDGDIWGIVAAAINGKQLAADTNGIYFVLTAPGVGESSGFLTTYCGWHTAATLNGQWIKYAFVGDANGDGACEAQTASSPNNDPPVDAMISVIAHELGETVTDPLINAWYDSSGEEIGDKCAWNFGTTFAAPNGSAANVTLGGFDFLIQQLFSNASDSCVMTYSASPNFSLSASPASQSVATGGTTGNYTVTVNPVQGFDNAVSLSVTGVPNGASVVNLTPNPTTTSATFAVNAGTAAPGTYTLTLIGTSGALSQQTTVKVTITAPLSFTVSATPSTQTVKPKSPVKYTVTVTGNATVTLSVSGLPSKVSGAFSPSSITGNGNSTLTVSANPNAPASKNTLTITGTSGANKVSVNTNLIVQ